MNKFKSITVLLLLMTFIFTGCAKSPEDARKELGKMNVAYDTQSFIKTVESNDMVAFKLFLEAGMDVNSTAEFGVTPLMMAAKKNRTEIAKQLIEKKANVNAGDQYGYSALLFAIQGESKGAKPNIDMVKLLLEKGAEINIQTDGLGTTPLIEAIGSKNMDTIKLLLDKGANVNLKSKNGVSTIGAINIKEISNMKTADVKISDADKAMNVEILKLLIEKGVDVNEKTSGSGFTPLVEAILTRNIEMMKLLVDRGADVNSIVEDSTVLAIAVGLKDLEMTKILVEKGANVNAKNKKDGLSVLMLAVIGGADRNPKPEIVRYLVEKGADVNAWTNGWSPLRLNNLNRNPEVGKILSDAGAKYDFF